MSYIKAMNETEQQYFDFLEDLRQSGDTNMFGASPYLQAAFGLEKKEGVSILSAWMDAHKDKSRIMEGPLSKKEVSVSFETKAIRKERRR